MRPEVDAPRPYPFTVPNLKDIYVGVIGRPPSPLLKQYDFALYYMGIDRNFASGTAISGRVGRKPPIGLLAMPRIRPVEIR